MASPPHKWTEVEDEILRQLIRENGKQWNIIAKHLPNRSVAQIASRWEKCLDPNLNKVGIKCRLYGNKFLAYLTFGK